MKHTQNFAALLALVGGLALVVQSVLTVSHHMDEGRSLGFGVVMYTGYFTITTNALCALIALAFSPWFAADRRFATLREPWVVTCATASIVMVGLVYHLLLSRLFHQQGVQAICNAVLHYTIPPLFPILWWFAVPRNSLVWSDAWRVLSYPLGYLVYVVARGEATGLYPYFFIDVPRIGYAQALLNAAGLSVVFIAAGALLIAIKGTMRPASADDANRG